MKKVRRRKQPIFRHPFQPAGDRYRIVENAAGIANCATAALQKVMQHRFGETGADAGNHRRRPQFRERTLRQSHRSLP